MSFLVALAVLTSGLNGVVMRGPTQPVCQVGKPCDAPAVGAVLVFSRAGHVAAQVRAGTGGHYSVRLAPGVYAVRVSPQPKIGTGIKPAQVTVVSDVVRRVNFFIDTGIR
jgi:hypothetical protein